MIRYINCSDTCYAVNYNTEDSLILDNHLDVLLHLGNISTKGWSEWDKFTKSEMYDLLRFNSSETNSSENKEVECHYSGGLVYPKKRDNLEQSDRTGSGNVVIIGEPGVGKSTLSFQIGLCCTSKINEGIAVYYSLDYPRRQMVNSMLKEEYRNNTINYCDEIPEKDDINDTAEDLYEYFTRILNKKNGKIIPQMLMPSLSPKGFAKEEGSQTDAVFRQRYKEIEYMLKAIWTYNHDETNKDSPKVRVVIIDSLDDFSDEPLTEAEVHKLFKVFEYYGIMGVFTMAENKWSTSKEQSVVRGVMHDADTIIKLESIQYENYECNIFSVPKSRALRCANGEHPYKMRDKPIYSYNSDNVTDKMIKFIDVLPSLHNVISGCSSEVVNKSEQTPKHNMLGVDAFNCILPDNNKYDGVVTIVGETGLFKADIATNALLAGLLDKKPALFIRMSERNALAVNGVRLEKSIYERYINKFGKDGRFVFNNKVSGEIYGCATCKMNQNENKRTIYCWKEKSKDIAPIYEIIFESGALLPEEFFEDIVYFISCKGVKNVVLSDIKYIGTSYPFLQKSRTSNDMFLSTFIHIMKKHKVNLITTCSDSDYEPSANDMRRMRILSDSIIEINKTSDYPDENSSGLEITGEGCIINNKICHVFKSKISVPVTFDSCNNLTTAYEIQ